MKEGVISMKVKTILKFWILALFVLLSLSISDQVFAGTNQDEISSSADKDLAISSSAADNHAIGIVNTGALNVRSGPGVEFGVITVIYKGQAVNLLGKFHANNWVNIRLSNGLEGWVNSNYLNSNVPVSQLPVIGAPDPQPPANVTPSAVVTTGALNVRSGPGPNFSILTVVRQGEQLALLGRNSTGSWVKVRTASNVEGWVNASYIQTNVPVSSLPVVDSPAPTPAAVVTASSANVRTGPGGQYEVIAVLSQGQTVPIQGRNNASTWIQVTLGNGQVGWVRSNAVQTNLPISSLPVVDFQPPTNTAIVNTGALNVRYGPGTNFGVFTVLVRGQVVSMVGRAAYSTWVQVRLPSGSLGWVNSNYLLTSIPIAELPIVYP
jgi:uncharacterized protein YraI